MSRLLMRARAWRTKRTLLRAANLPAEQIPAAPPRDPAQPPVFVLSAGWRSGSTAVQRLVVSGGQAFVWGEPYALARLLPRLYRIAVESVAGKADKKRVLADENVTPALDKTWIATTHPAPAHLMRGVRELLVTTYWSPLADTSFTTWGTKEVAIRPEHVRLLRVLFPDARFVCLVRDPVTAYRSFRAFVVVGVAPPRDSRSSLSWVEGPFRYARLWRELSAEFRAMANDPHVRVFRYEDIAGDESFVATLQGFLGMDLSADAWKLRLGESKPRTRGPLAWLEETVVRRMTRREAAAWGYRT